MNSGVALTVGYKFRGGCMKNKLPRHCPGCWQGHRPVLHCAHLVNCVGVFARGEWKACSTCFLRLAVHSLMFKGWLVEETYFESISFRFQGPQLYPLHHKNNRNVHIGKAILAFFHVEEVRKVQLHCSLLGGGSCRRARVGGRVCAPHACSVYTDPRNADGMRAHLPPPLLKALAPAGSSLLPF